MRDVAPSLTRASLGKVPERDGKLRFSKYPGEAHIDTGRCAMMW